MYALTEAGQAYAAEHAEELRGSWDAVAGMTDDEAIELGDPIRQVMIAVPARCWRRPAAARPRLAARASPRRSRDAV